MEISLFDSWSRNLSTVAITGYQKYLSPHKGFSCAHRVLYGGESCSQYIKRVIAQEGLSVALLKSRQRFQDCKQANLLLRSPTAGRSPSRRVSSLMETRLSSIENPDTSEDEDDLELEDEEETRESPPSRQISSFNQDSRDCSQCNTDCGDLPDCSSLDCSDVDCSSLDCGNADCHSLDCGSADCGSWDCGSCGN
ncbi:MAG TPA: membrane protein insertion efficiency factor YidD [Trichormus sp. M33_DOE_039]|nr:membrane protein insertion efficiency factor YidD [Trichormus sp. M33_DOE_039]